MCDAASATQAPAPVAQDPMFTLVETIENLSMAVVRTVSGLPPGWSERCGCLGCRSAPRALL